MSQFHTNFIQLDLLNWIWIEFHGGVSLIKQHMITGIFHTRSRIAEFIIKKKNGENDMLDSSSHFIFFPTQSNKFNALALLKVRSTGLCIHEIWRKKHISIGFRDISDSSIGNYPQLYFHRVVEVIWGICKNISKRFVLKGNVSRKRFNRHKIWELLTSTVKNVILSTPVTHTIWNLNIIRLVQFLFYDQKIKNRKHNLCHTNVNPLTRWRLNAVN